MRDPATYNVLLKNIFRLRDDAQLLLEAGRYPSAYALAIYVIEESAKYSSFVGELPLSGKGPLHVQRQELMGQYLQSTAIFEAFAREVDGLLEHLRATNAESRQQATTMSRHDLIDFAIRSVTGDPQFDTSKFVRKVLGDDLSQTFGADAKTGRFHKQRQQAFHADYDANGKLTANPFDITQEQAEEMFELAWLAAQLQTLWQRSWDDRKGA